MAQSVKCLTTLGFGSGHDLAVHESESRVGLCADMGACLGCSLALSLCPAPARDLFLSKINNL